jgi:hypothetical protein
VTTRKLRSRARIGALLLCCAILPVLSGCSLWDRVFHRSRNAGCTEKPFALNTDSRPPLKIPDGMSAPDTRTAIKVPDLTAAERVRAKTEPCLSRPPNYFDKPLPPLRPPPPPPKRWWQFWRKRPPPAPPLSPDDATAIPGAPMTPMGPAPEPAPAQPAPK